MDRLKKLIEGAFENQLYKDTQDVFLKYYSKDALKTLWVLKTSGGLWNGNVKVARQDYYWSGQAPGAAYAKAQVLAMAIRAKDQEYET